MELLNKLATEMQRNASVGGVGYTQEYISILNKEESMDLHCRVHSLVDIYHSSQDACASCPMKARCCPNTPMRKIARSVHEAARDVARAVARTNAYQQSRKDRKKVEMLFAHMKRIMKLDRLRLRGLSGAKDEFLLAATAQNLRRMAKWLVPMAEKEAMAPA